MPGRALAHMEGRPNDSGGGGGITEMAFAAPHTAEREATGGVMN